MASGILQEDGEYVVHSKEGPVNPVPDLNSACGRAEAVAMPEETVEESN